MPLCGRARDRRRCRLDHLVDDDRRVQRAGYSTMSYCSRSDRPQVRAQSVSKTVALSASLSDDEPMRTHVALLRGINVLGRNKVSMEELRQIVASLGHSDVVTYIQSGNVVFTAAKPGAKRTVLEEDLERAIAGVLAVRPAVVVLTRRELSYVVRDNPFRDEADHRLLHAVFLREAPGPTGVASVAAAVERARSKDSRDDARVVGRTIYLWTPDGFARSVLRSELSRGGKLRSPMEAGTARNWRTVNTLVSLLDP